MLYEGKFKNPDQAGKILEHIRQLACGLPQVRLMEICGTHTMAIARFGIRSLMPENVKLLSGPGCPVCVTPQGVIDDVLKLSGISGITIVSYGDLIRVPGSHKGDTLMKRKASGDDIRVVYSPMEAVEYAREHEDRQVVFLGVGFETTAPGTAACILEADRLGLTNFSVLCLLKQTFPALRLLIEDPDFHVDGFLCPGHVAAITGWEAFSFLPGEYDFPAVVGGFEAGDMLVSIEWLLSMVKEKKPELKNEYLRLVHREGNCTALSCVHKVFESADSQWRGLGMVPMGGYRIRDAYASFDAARKFSLSLDSGTEPQGCRCGQIIRGMLDPDQCPLFGKICTPSDPVGPCMVSGEGACAAAWHYENEGKEF
ncbi:MAG: hydrogenase formation protein HypD [Ruminococcus sp.]|jgi:hydrogenase expression/formation protein HypD